MRQTATPTNEVWTTKKKIHDTKMAVVRKYSVRPLNPLKMRGSQPPPSGQDLTR